jgi:mannose-6-phosphate isomerase-like protein (cupin superfamily)
MIQELLGKVNEKWEPLDVAFVNDTDLRIAKVEGPYGWHIHLREDEFFFVLKGKMLIDTDTEDGTVELNEMEGYLVKKGTKHRSRTEAGKPAWIMLVEPTRTITKGEGG